MERSRRRSGVQQKRHHHTSRSTKYPIAKSELLQIPSGRHLYSHRSSTTRKKCQRQHLCSRQRRLNNKILRHPIFHTTLEATNRQIPPSKTHLSRPLNLPHQILLQPHSQTRPHVKVNPLQRRPPHHRSSRRLPNLHRSNPPHNLHPRPPLRRSLHAQTPPHKNPRPGHHSNLSRPANPNPFPRTRP